ncbi:hypothetical protein QR98_0018050 [Sarcoptes scabiei]|uniref:Uncharacterized protein n=1 Tax=Sarcoptes scabiei TaxID=52283 RepID=A0A131ZXE8_SARSC|nr:hypothetical protein QR98_0018050 [Sarcoptes scabiei]
MSSSDSVDRKRLSFLNLNSIVYRVFLRLYAMYPCNFLHFLKTNYGIGCNNKESCLVYVEIIEPMLAKIRFHPLLITSSKDQECDKSRWFYKEPHDILDECSQYSIDPVESTFFDFELSDLYRLFRKNEDGGDEEDDKSSPLMDDDDDENVEENFDSIYDQNSDSIFSELARQTESKKDINDVDLAKRRLNNPKTNSESAQEAIILSKKVSQTCAAPSCSMVDHRIDQQQNNLIKPVAVSAAENSFSSSSSKNPRANFQIKKQCFSPFKPINDSSEISDFSFDETSSNKKMDRLNQIENESFVSNNDNEDVDMEIMSYNLGRKSSKNLNDFPDDDRINGFNDNVNTNEKIMDKSPFDAGKKPIDDSLASFKHINIRTRYQSHCLADTFNNQDENDMNDPSLSSLSTKSISRSCPTLYSNIRDILSLETNANELEDDRKNRTNDHSAKQHRNSESKIILKTGENDSNIGECLKQSKKIRNKTCKSVDFTKEIKSYFSYNQSSILHQNSKITNLDRLLLSFRDSRKFLYQSSSSIDFVGNLNKFEINSPHQLLDRTLSTLSDVYLKDSIETKRKTSEEIVMDQNQANRSDSIEHISSLDYLNSNLNDEDMRKILAILYAQLVFERHQRDLHVIRNRRLYKKAKDFIQLEEKLHTIEEQARLKTNEIGKLQSVLDRSSKQFDLERKQFSKEINNLNETLIRFKANYDELMKEKINLELHYKQEIDNLNQNFRMNELELNRYLCSGNKNVDLAKLEKENQELKNQIFFFGEFCGKVRDAYYQNKSQPAIYDKILFESLRNENEGKLSSFRIKESR